MKRSLIDNSSKVTSVGYDAPAGCLEVEYKWGAIIRYFKIKPEMASDLMAADSKGSFLAKYIERKFPFARLSPGEEDIVPAPAAADEFQEPEPDVVKDQRIFERDRAINRAGEDEVPRRPRRMRLL